MKRGGVGGASTYTGLIFEKQVSLENLLARIPGYQSYRSTGAGNIITYEGHEIAKYFEKHGLYRFLEHQGVNWKSAISGKLLPDSALLVRKTLFIIEVKYQEAPGSVDEKLQTCDFKRKQYQKLVRPLGMDVEYVYVLNRSWFDNKKYKDVFDYIKSVGCHYYFDEIPLDFLNLPDPGKGGQENV